MIAPCAGFIVEEGQLIGIRVHHRQRTQQALGVLVQTQ